jgi:regulator of sigma E protease
VPRAVDETVTLGGFILEQVGLLFTGGAAVSKSLGGPVEIFRQAKMAAERGIFDYARMMGQFSISLGVLNLLPIPVLDGGSIAMYTAEWIRGRRLPERVRERLQQVGLLFLVTLILFVAVFDIHRWVTSWMGPS